MRVTDQYFWNLIFSLFFLTLIGMGVVVLQSEAYKTIEEITLIDVTLMVLATWRLIRLFVYDAITKFFREQFWDAKEMKTKVVLTKPPSGPRRTLADLLSCPWCFGMWAAGMVVFFYLLTPLAFYIVLLLAISAVGTFLQLLSNMVGWRAEGLKNDAERY